MKKENITISDIAKLAEVSKTTVSRYLNGKYFYMSENTKDTIEKIIKEYNYQPSNVARSLKNKKTKLIGILVADIENPFSAATIKGISQALFKTSYNMIIADANNNFEQEKKMLQSFVEQRVEAIMINTTSYEFNHLLEIAKMMPVILLDRLVKDSDMDVVYADNEEPIYSVIDHLHSQGYEPIYLLTEPYNMISTRRDRRLSFLKKMKELGYENPDELTYITSKEDSRTIKDAIFDILSKKKNGKTPAVLAINGPTLMFATKIIKSNNISMPNEIGICGYDDFGSVTEYGWSELTNVPLTTLTPSWYELGKVATKIALERINGDISKRKIVSVSVPLIIRKSTSLNKK